MSVFNLELEDSTYLFNRNFLVGRGVKGRNNGEDFTIRFTVTFVSS